MKIVHIDKQKMLMKLLSLLFPLVSVPFEMSEFGAKITGKMRNNI